MSRLSKEERERIIAEIESGIDNQDYRIVNHSKFGKCLRPKHNKKRVSENTNNMNISVNSGENENIGGVSIPVNDIQHAKDKSWLDAIQYYNLGNTITMMNQNLQNLNERIDKYKAKTSKLKGKYKKLKRAIYEDDSEYIHNVDGEREIESVSVPVENINNEKREDDEEDNIQEHIVERPQQRVTKRNGYGWYFQ